MMNRTHLISLSCGIFLAFTACTTVQQPVKEVVLLPKPAPAPPAKAIKRTPGSLWSDDSRWNEMYAIPVSRLVGDMITLQIGDAFKSRVLAMMPPEPIPAKDKNASSSDRKTDTAIADGEKENERDRQQVRAAQQASSVATIDPAKETKSVEVVIREVLPRGAYRVYGSQIVVLDGKTGVVTFDGQVRERDIASSDIAPTDALVGIRMEVETKYSHLEAKR